MNQNQKAIRAVADELEEIEKRSAEIIAGDIGEDEEKEIKELAAKKSKLIERRQALGVLLEKEDAKSIVHDEPDAELRERLELRGKASLTEYIKAALSGRQVSGAEAELRDAAGIGDGIPLELWDTPEVEKRADATTGAPGTVGVNLAPIQPAVFAASIAPRLGIEMPRVESGTYASATISTSLTAGSKAAGAAQEATAAEFRVNSATPKRVSARMAIRIEDIASVGQANFESALRENLALVLSDELDDQAINGDGQAPNLSGIFKALTDPNDPSAVVDFDAFVASFAGGIDGLWANTLKDVGIVCGPATYRKSAQVFRDVGTNNGHRGNISFADYAAGKFGGWWTNKRMPDAASNIQQAILYRKGRSMKTAVCPHWGAISIDDIYSGSAQGERFLTMHVLLGDVILTQPDAYKQVAFKLA